MKKFILTAMTVALASSFSLSAKDIQVSQFLNCEDAQCEKELDQMRAFARRGSPEANYIMGTLYLYGEGVDKDEKKAKGYFQRAAENGLAESRYMIAQMYKHGMGVEKDPKLAQEYLEEAAEENSISAKFDVAIQQLNQENGDLQKAVKYLETAASRRNADASFILGKLYMSGYKGIAADEEQGKDHLLAAAKRGHRGAQQLMEEIRKTASVEEKEKFVWAEPEDDVEVITVVGQPQTLMEYLDWYSDGIESQKIYDGRSVFRTGRACNGKNGCQSYKPTDIITSGGSAGGTAGTTN